MKQLFTSDAWAENRLSHTQSGKHIEKRILDNNFWDSVAHILKIYEPLYGVLRLVDTEIVPTMPILYDLIYVMKKMIQQQKGTKWVLEIIKKRWDEMLLHPLHAAGMLY